MKHNNGDDTDRHMGINDRKDSLWTLKDDWGEGKGNITDNKICGYTFIIHHNQNKNWRTSSKISYKTESQFATFDYGGQTYVIYFRERRGGSNTQRRERIGRYLQFNDAGLTEMYVTTQKIKNIRAYILYWICNSAGSLHQYVTKRSTRLMGVQKELQEYLDNMETQKGIIIDSNICKQYWEYKKENLHIGTKRASNVFDITENLIDKNKIQSVADWELLIDKDIKRQLIKEFGLNILSYI